MHCPSDPDAFTASKLWRCLPGFYFDALSNPLAVIGQVNSEGLTQAAGTTCQFFDLVGFPPLAHPMNSPGGLDCPDQNCAGALAIRCEIQAVVHSINKIDVDVTERVLHH
jgi:hypothetical protein